MYYRFKLDNIVNYWENIMEELHIYNKLNNINDLKSESNIKSVLNDTCKDILEYTKCNGISIYLYNDEDKKINPYIVLGDANKYIELYKELSITDDVVKGIIYGTAVMENIKSKEEFAHIPNINKYIDDKCEKERYIGYYEISVDSELIGFLSVSYTYKPDNFEEPNQFIEFICKVIAIIIRSYKLNEEIKIESKKRNVIENELEDYLNASTDLILVFDPINNIMKINDSWQSTLGWDYSQLINNRTMDYIHKEDLQKVKEINEFMGSYNNVCNDKGSVVLRYLCKDGGYKHIKWNIKYSHRSNMFIFIGKDITQKIIVEEKNKSLEENIKAETYKNEFFANVSHEFKTPLNIILGTMQIMKRNVDEDHISKENIYRHIKNIKQNSYRLLRLVNNLIDINKIDSGHYKLSFSNNNIVSIIEDITMSVIPYVENKNINLIFDTDSEEIITSCDPESIERIILNLLSNAIKYTPSDIGEIIVGIKRNEDKIFISVKDNGSGISQEKIDVIFNRFEQGNDTLTRNKEGSGIGLSLVKSIVELYDGSIRVESNIGEGSEFIIELPIKLCLEESSGNKTYSHNDNEEYYIEKCNVEFSDIYS